LADLVILTAEELKARSQAERQVARRAAREEPLVRQILRTFLERGGPIPIQDIAAASSGGSADAIHDALIALDDDDLIRIRAAHIDVAYPFAAAPTPFRVQLRDGRERYACCATDALGVAPMVGEPVEIRSQCHHCGALLNFSVTPHGPGPEAEGVMVWFGKRGDDRCKAIDGL
jgi:alkylmercury lyase-like protein